MGIYGEMIMLAIENGILGWYSQKDVCLAHQLSASNTPITQSTHVNSNNGWCDMTSTVHTLFISV